MPLPITAFYAGILALWVLFLAFQVVSQRRAAKVSIGTGDDPTLETRIRGHGNATETVPIGLILLGLSEGMSMPAWLLHLFGVALLAGRLLHGFHFLAPRDGLTLRFWGMVLTISSIAMMALGLIGNSLPRIF
ncbi:MAG: MAPEG family protein [Pseudomonadota bacterium]